MPSAPQKTATGVPATSSLATRASVNSPNGYALCSPSMLTPTTLDIAGYRGSISSV